MRKKREGEKKKQVQESDVGGGGWAGNESKELREQGVTEILAEITGDQVASWVVKVMSQDHLQSKPDPHTLKVSCV